MIITFAWNGHAHFRWALCRAIYKAISEDPIDCGRPPILALSSALHLSWLLLIGHTSQEYCVTQIKEKDRWLLTNPTTPNNLCAACNQIIRSFCGMVCHPENINVRDGNVIENWIKYAPQCTCPPRGDWMYRRAWVCPGILIDILWYAILLNI